MSDRPGWTEIGAVLVVCAVLFGGLVALDDAALHRYQRQAPGAGELAPAGERPQARTARQAGELRRTGELRAPVVVRHRAPVRVDAEDLPGRAMALSWLGLLAAGGAGMAAVGARMLRRRWA